jgi:hypothetical protein
MSHSHPLMRAALPECETVARTRGHTLGRWQTVSEEIFASVCMVCAKLAWVTLPRGEKRPRTGGSVLRQDCLVEDALRASSSGD